jgi:predicted membrane-bound spermidine synthase
VRDEDVLARFVDIELAVGLVGGCRRRCCS